MRLKVLHAKRGSITINNLSKLQILTLYDNRIQGFILANLCHLKNLGASHLGKNNLSELIPACLWNITSLRYLDLDSNKLISSIPTKLIYRRTNSQDKSQAPLEVYKLVDLEFCDLSHNNLFGVIPKSLEELLQLRYFNVSFNRLRGEIPSRGSFANFTY
ncbi:hypothetical protein ACSBR1_014529 [Camellia fascicularis]